MPQVVSRRPLTAEARIRPRVTTCGVEKVALGQVSLQDLRYLPVSIIPSGLHTRYIMSGMNNRPDGHRSSETYSHPMYTKKQLTPLNTVLLQKLTAALLVNTWNTFKGIWNIITSFNSPPLISILIQIHLFLDTRHIPLRYIWTVPYFLNLDNSSGFFLSCLPTEEFLCISHLPQACHMSSVQTPWFRYPNNIWSWLQISS
jgi:hypothetical protein